MYYHRVLAFSRRRRRWLLYAGGAAGAYLIYHHPAVAARRRRLARLASALASLADAVAAVASDLAAFLRSDSDAVPQTLKQISKLAASPEASASASALSGALAAGVLRGYAAASASGSRSSGGDVAFSDHVLEKMLSPSGERLASAVAGSFGHHLVLAFYSAPSEPSTDSLPTSWVDVLTTRRCKRAIGSWVEVFTATAVGVFIDKTIHINTYDQLFAAATNPAYDSRLQELFVALCSSSVETLVKTSHTVLSSANSADVSGTPSSNGGVGEGWVETVSSALAVPSNRKLLLDLTGMATFEAVRSFLEFVLWKLHAGARAGGDATVGAGLRALSDNKVTTNQPANVLFGKSGIVLPLRPVLCKSILLCNLVDIPSVSGIVWPCCSAVYSDAEVHTVFLILLLVSSGAAELAVAAGLFRTFREWVRRTLPKIRVAMSNLECLRIFSVQTLKIYVSKCADQGRGEMHVVIKLTRSISFGWLTCCICQEVIAWPYPFRHLECCRRRRILHQQAGNETDSENASGADSGSFVSLFQHK